MRSLLQLAWRNIWRNPRRTVILICAMMAGLIGVLASMGMTYSWLEQIRANSVRFYEGHCKIFAQGYADNPVVENSLAPIPGLDTALNNDGRIRAWADRVAVQALLQTPRRSVVITVVGVDAAAEPRVSDVPAAIREGAFLDQAPSYAQPIVIGRRLSRKLNMGLGKKIVLMSQQYGGNEVGSGAFRISGIYDTGVGGFDDHYAYIRKADAQAMLNLGDRITETVIMLYDQGQSEAVTATLRKELAGAPVDVLSWMERLPFVLKTIELSNQMMIPYYAIFYVAMAFGIVNTLLMAIGERAHEIGVMMAIGMRRRRLVLLFLLESLLIALVAVALGTLAGWGLVAWLGRVGIDLSAMAEGIDYMGMDRVLYPRLDWPGVVIAALTALAVAAVFSLYPAFRAARLSPVQAIRMVA